MPKLVISLPDVGEATFELTDEIITLGRMPDNSVQIEDGSVSSHHAQLSIEGGDYRLKDLNSTNGTAVNGQHGTDWLLQDGDKVKFGSIEGVYQSEIAAARPLPQTGEHAVTVGESSQRPSNFANASPFKTKKKAKDPVGMAMMAFGGVAILAFLGAMAMIFTLQPPQ